MIKSVAVGELETNCYIVWDEKSGDAAVIDPGSDGAVIEAELKALGLRPARIINTHGHFDHIGANAKIKKTYGAALAIHSGDAALLGDAKSYATTFGIKTCSSPEPDSLLKDGDTVTIGSHALEVIHTPGHTPGGVCFYDKAEKILITGDTLFAGSVGRTDLPGGSYETLMDSIRTKILPIDDDVRVYPGHGPDSTIGTEKQTNPYLMELNK